MVRNHKLFNILGIANSSIPNTPNRRIPFQTVLKERLLYFNTIIFKGLMA